MQSNILFIGRNNILTIFFLFNNLIYIYIPTNFKLKVVLALLYYIDKGFYIADYLYKQMSRV